MRCRAGPSRGIWIRGKAVRLALFLLLVWMMTGCQPVRVQPSVKIGLVAPFEGPYRAIGYEVIYAVRLALREANAAGGVGGYSVELVAFDDGADPVKAVEEARKVVADPDVVAVLGHFRGDTTRAAVEVYAEAGVPLVVPGESLDGIDLRNLPVFAIAPSIECWRAALERQVGGQGCVEIARMTHVRALPGYGLCTRIDMNDVGWQNAVVMSGVGVAFTREDSIVSGDTVVALDEIGWGGSIVGEWSMATTEFLSIAREAAEGVMFLSAWPLDSASDAFIAEYQELSDGLTPGVLAVLAYESTWLLLESLKESLPHTDQLPKDAVAQALATGEREGALNVLAFDETHHLRNCQVCIYEIRDGWPYLRGCQP